MRAERAGSVAGVVLAAGASTRMGSNKLLLPLEGESVVRRAVRRAGQAGLDPVLVVLGHEADRVFAELAGLACRPVLNPEPSRGMNGSIRTGIAVVPPEAIAAMVILADMPFVTASMMAALVERYRGGGAPLVVSDYGGVLAPPILYQRSLFRELAVIEGDGCGKRVVRRHLEEALLVSWPAAALGDLDVPTDYQRVKSELGAE